MDAATYFDIVQGSRRGLAAHITRGVLSCARAPYWAAVVARNYFYDHYPRAVQRVSVPVISVGNLTLGGTGKTPFVAWLAKWLRARGMRVAIVSRGYKATPGHPNDEALELEQQMWDVPHLQNVNRCEAARVAIEQFDSQVILLDDGFQHRRLYRDLDIVLLDGLQPFGLPQKLFPRGTLREPLSGLQRADAVVLTRADQVSSGQRAWIENTARQYAPTMSWSTGAHQPVELRCHDGGCQQLDTLVDQRVFAFCGIGNAAAFRRTLQQCGAQIVGFREFPDHHHFSRQDMEHLARAVELIPQVHVIVCTMKDLVKINTHRLAKRPVYALAIEMHLQQGLAELEEKLTRALQAGMAGASREVGE